MLSRQDDPELASRLARILNLPQRSGTSADLAELRTIDDIVDDGLPTASVSALRAYLDALNLDCPVEPLGALSDRRGDTEGRLSREQGLYVLNLASALAEVERVFHEDERRMRRFLQSPHALLEGRAPIEHLCGSTNGSATDILDILHQAAAGVPV